MPSRPSIYVPAKDTPVNFLLIVGHAGGKSEALRDFASGIAQQREAKLVLVGHERRLVHRLRRNGNQGCASFFDLGIDRVHRFHLSDAEWTPASPNKADD